MLKRQLQCNQGNSIVNLLYQMKQNHVILHRHLTQDGAYILRKMFKGTVSNFLRVFNGKKDIVLIIIHRIVCNCICASIKNRFEVSLRFVGAAMLTHHI